MNKKTQKFIIIGLVILAISIPVASAHATSIVGSVLGDLTEFFVVKPLFFITQLLSIVANWFFALGAFFVNMALNFNDQLMNFNVNSLVPTGWRIVRDISNLGFVLLIIIIAIATILRREQYGVKKLLPTLIAAAILVNFSLTIAGVFIDFSNVLTHFFYSRVSDSNLSISSALANAFNPQTLFRGQLQPTSNSANSVELITQAVANLAFVIVFTLIGTLTLLAMALMLLLRYLWLSFLLIISPIVWLFWVFPGLSSQFSKWWSKFFQWTFFAPASAFFIYLAILSLEGLKNQQSQAIAGGQQIFGQVSGLADIASHGAQMIVISGILLGGLLMAQNMGITGASAALSIASKAKGAALGWAGQRALGVGRRAVTLGTNKEGKTGLERLAGTKILGKELRAIPVAGAMFRGLSTLSSKTKESMTKGVDAELEKNKPETKTNLVAKANAAAFGPGPRIESPQELAALGIAAAEKGGWEEINAKQQTRIIDAIRRTGSAEKFIGFVPTAAPQLPNAKGVPYTIAEAMGKVQDVTKLSKDMLSNPEVTLNLRPGQLAELGQKADNEKKTTILAQTQTVRVKQVYAHRSEIDSLTKQIEEAKATGDQSKLNYALGLRKVFEANLNTLLDGIRTDTDETDRKALAVADIIHQSPSWQSIVPRATLRYTPIP